MRSSGWAMSQSALDAESGESRNVQKSRHKSALQKGRVVFGEAQIPRSPGLLRRDPKGRAKEP